MSYKANYTIFLAGGPFDGRPVMVSIDQTEVRMSTDSSTKYHLYEIDHKSAKASHRGVRDVKNMRLV